MKVGSQNQFGSPLYRSNKLWTRHIAGFVATPKYHSGRLRTAGSILGSGGGFPGVSSRRSPSQKSGAGWVDLVESNHKKCGFLRTATRWRQAPEESVHPLRIEDAASKLPRWPRLHLRARASRTRPACSTMPTPGPKPIHKLKLIFHKGRDYQAEIDKARGRWDFDLVKHQSVVEAGFRNLGDRPR
jgi:16S rRNA (guanine527-N7)-methyltransferase